MYIYVIVFVQNTTNICSIYFLGVPKLDSTQGGKQSSVDIICACQVEVDSHRAFIVCQSYVTHYELSTF